MHLRRLEDFEALYSSGQKAGDDHMLIFAAANQLGTNRLGLSVSKKHGSAVIRNLKRRRIREAFRRLQHDLPPGLDLIAIPRQRSDSTLQDYRNSLRTLLRKLVRRLTELERKASSSGSLGGDS